MSNKTNKVKENIESIRIYEAGIGDVDLVALLVFNLLKELGQELSRGEENKMFRACKEILEEDNLSKALIALNKNNVPVSVMTLAEAQALSAYGRFGIIMEHYVEPEFRSYGVGQKMMEAAIELGRRLGWNSLQVAAPVGNMGQRTQTFYERHHFKDAGQYLQLSLKKS